MYCRDGRPPKIDDSRTETCVALSNSSTSFFVTLLSNFRCRWNSHVEVNWFDGKSAGARVTAGPELSTQPHWAEQEAEVKQAGKYGANGCRGCRIGLDIEF